MEICVKFCTYFLMIGYDFTMSTEVLKPKSKKKYNLDDFLDIVECLKSPKGFLWDRLQTHASIRLNMVEEAYEIIEAIDTLSISKLKEELGDMLLQIAFHCSIENKKENFCFNDVVDGICRKTIAYHPHIFKGTIYDNEENDTKEFLEEPFSRLRFSQKNSLIEKVENISKVLPELIRATKIQDSAAKGGYGVFSIEEGIEEAFKRLKYVENLINMGDSENYYKEIGNLIFAITNIARLLSVDPENALYDSCERFKRKFLLAIEKKNKV